MFAILVPVSLAPLIITLLWAERKARKLGVIARSKHTDNNPSESYSRRILNAAEKLDVLGLLLIGTSVALILLPLTLSQSAKGGWRNGMLHPQLFTSTIPVAELLFVASMIAMIVVGGVLIPVYALWDLKFAKYPVIARRFVFNRSVVIASVIGAADFVCHLLLMYIQLNMGRYRSPFISPSLTSILSS